MLSLHVIYFIIKNKKWFDLNFCDFVVKKNTKFRTPLSLFGPVSGSMWNYCIIIKNICVKKKLGLCFIDGYQLFP